jgi:hypothetical protein
VADVLHLQECLQILPRVMVDVSVLVPIFALFQVLLAVLAAVLTTILLPLIALAVPAAAVLDLPLISTPVGRFENHNGRRYLLR